MFKQIKAVTTVDGTLSEISEILGQPITELATALQLPAQLKRKDGSLITDPAEIWTNVQSWVANLANGVEVAPAIKTILQGNDQQRGVLKSILLLQNAPGLDRVAKLSGETADKIVASYSALSYEDMSALAPRLAVVASATEYNDDTATAVDALETALNVVIDPAGFEPLEIDPSKIEQAVADNQTSVAAGTPAEDLVTEAETPATSETPETPTEDVAAEVVNNLPAPPASVPPTVLPTQAVSLMQSNAALLNGFQQAFEGTRQTYEGLGVMLKAIQGQQQALTALLEGAAAPATATVEVPATV